MASKSINRGKIKCQGVCCDNSNLFFKEMSVTFHCLCFVQRLFWGFQNDNFGSFLPYIAPFSDCRKTF